MSLNADGNISRSRTASRLLPLLDPVSSPLKTFRSYDARKLRRDIVAGLTVSVVELPQAMAYALVAGVPPQYGIYTSVIQGLFGALFGGSEHLRSGPTNTQSLLIASAVSTVVNPTGDPATYLRLVVGLTLLKGAIQLLFAAARLGVMVRYVSRSVIVGLSAGAGVLIAIGQLPNVLGIAEPSAPRRFAGALGQLDAMLRTMSPPGGKALAVCAISLAIFIGVRMISRLMPASLLAVVAGAALVAAMGWTSADLPLVGELPRAFPRPAVPRLAWGEAERLLGGAFALALIGMLESAAIAKTIAHRTGERIDANRESFAQGLGNVLSSFFQCIPGSGSFTRSALDHAAGGATRFAAVYNALFVAALFWGLSGWAGLIPLASLAAVLLVIAWGLVDWSYIPRMLRSSRSDAVVCGITFAATLVLRLEFAIFVGVFLNIALYLRTASRLHVSEMIPSPGGPFLERPILDKRTGERQVIFLQLEGDLFFAVADELQDRLSGVAASTARVVILRLKRTHSIDATVLGVLEKFAADLHARQRHVVLCGVKPNLMTVLRAYGLVERIGRENVFETGGGNFTSARRALQRARALRGRSIDIGGINVDEPDEPDYVI